MVTVWARRTDLANSSAPDADYALQMASWILYKLTAEKYPGVSEHTEVYTRDSGGSSSLVGRSLREHGIAMMATCDEGSTSLSLRHLPVLGVISVEESGRSVRLSNLVLSGNRTLRKRDKSPWDLSGGVRITYSAGMAPPTAGRSAAARLADQFIYAFTGSDECRLPDRVTSISRQGVSYTVLDPQEFIRDGRTGLYEVDLFIQAANPNKAKKRARVFSPDAPRVESELSLTDIADGQSMINLGEEVESLRVVIQRASDQKFGFTASGANVDLTGAVAQIIVENGPTWTATTVGNTFSWTLLASETNLSFNLADARLVVAQSGLATVWARGQVVVR